MRIAQISAAVDVDLAIEPTASVKPLYMNFSCQCGPLQPSKVALYGYAIGLKPVQRTLKAVFSGLFAVAGAVVGVKGVWRAVVDHKL